MEALYLLKSKLLACDKGQNRAMRQAIADTCPLTSYFTRKSSPLQARLPRGYQKIHDGRDNDKPVDQMQSTMHRWLVTLQSLSPL
eukprot:5853608-Ditylum_brightwellii.AAC.1